MKKIALINDLSGFGKCSITAALPIISAHSVQCCPLPTGVFSNQTGYESYKSVDLTEYMQGFIDEWKKLGTHFDGILTGFILNSRQGEIISKFIDDFRDKNTVVVVDPCMADDGVIYDCYDEESISAVKAIAKKGDIITPNLTELFLLCNREYSENVSTDEIYEMSKSFGDKTVITTGIQISENEIANAVYDGENFELIKSKRLGGHFSGTGDIFSSYVLSEYINGENIFTAVRNASSFIEKSIEETLKNTEAVSYHAEGIDFEKFLTIK